MDRKSGHEEPEATDLIAIYFQQASETPLLSSEDERHLFHRIEQGRKARQQILSDGHTDKTRQELIAVAQDGLIARDQVIRANLRLVISVANSYHPTGIVDFLDLIGFGNVGLLRAIPKFDYRRGNKFSTYAVWWIRQSISRALDNYSRVIRLPAHVLRELRRVRKAHGRINQEQGREVSLAALAQFLPDDEADLRDLEGWGHHSQSLEDLMENDGEPLNWIEDPQAVDPELRYTKRELQQLAQRLLAELEPREARLVKLRFGLRGGTPLSLAEIGRKFGVSRERARQMESRALDKLRTLHHLAFSNSKSAD